MQAGIYTRISLDADGTSTATQRQQADCERLASDRGWTVAGVYEDSDTSAWRRGVRRPSFDRLVADLRSGTINAVIAWRMDRLTRNWKDMERLQDAARAGGGRFVTVSDGVDSSTSTGAFIAELHVALGKQESQNIATRLARKHRERAENGIACGGPRPYGYESSRRTEIVPAEAAIVREAVARIIEGESLTVIARDLNVRGVTATRGGPWSTLALREMILAPGTAGLRMVDGAPVAANGWTGLITAEEQEQVRAVLLRRAGPMLRSGRATFLLSAGLAICSLCGGFMRGGRTSTGKGRYACRPVPGRVNCGRIAVANEALDAFVLAVWLDAASNPEVLKPKATTGDSAEVSNELTRIEASLAQLAQDHAEDLLTRGEWLAARATLARRREQAVERLSRLRSTPTLVGIIGSTREELTRRMEAAPLAKRRALVSALIAQVRVLPASAKGARFSAARVEIVWRA